MSIGEAAHAVAQKDTPGAVDVPNNLIGLCLWFVGRFGVGALFALVLGYGLREVYYDLRDLTKTMMETQVQTATAILKVNSTLDELLREARNAHGTRAPGP